MRDPTGEVPRTDVLSTTAFVLPTPSTVNVHGEHRSNATHESTTDPEARLFRRTMFRPTVRTTKFAAPTRYVADSRENVTLRAITADLTMRLSRKYRSDRRPTTVSLGMKRALPKPDVIGDE